ncbi:MAG TPA: undecaprenyl-diphosphate phosphatase [Caulobacterales bacterium]|nr:undecaprenyl-diphosphate phosphatase [Caulobacterales bacterium]
MDLVNLLKAALLGIVQGLTEFLPVSSTAHLLIGEKLLGFDDPGGAFTVMIQLGSILAVMWLYRVKIFDVIVGLPTKPEARRFALAIILAFIPAVIAGLFLADFVKTVLYESLTVVAWALLIGGVIMLIVERIAPKGAITDAQLTPPHKAFGIGLFQILALIPGVSRSGSTIYGGLLLGLDRKAAAEFSFFLAMPTMVAAFAHDLKGLETGGFISTERIAEIGIGFVMAFLAALVVVKPFVAFIGRSGFTSFAIYRIVIGAALLGAATMGWL